MKAVLNFGERRVDMVVSSFNQEPGAFELEGYANDVEAILEGIALSGSRVCIEFKRLKIFGFVSGYWVGGLPVGTSTTQQQSGGFVRIRIGTKSTKVEEKKDTGGQEQ